MSIGPFLEGQVFVPALIETMGQALDDACASIGLTDKEGATARFLAMRIIKEARAGVRDRAALKAAAIWDFKRPDMGRT